ncbi:hypothetical protein UPYG_G00241840 [Umbra pygmaea]|uniref:receptor protein-tyrosine kinase n=1 Tax=Umbra pygmaea TaxID=75934 RepID=A0ABD0WKU0_UMBPY
MLAVRWNCIWLICCIPTFAQPIAEEVELFNSVNEARLTWTSDPPKYWTETPLKMVSETNVPVYQACTTTNKRRSLLTNWMARKDALHIVLDLKFSQEEEPPPKQFSPLQIHLLESNFPLSKFIESPNVVGLNASKKFPLSTKVDQLKEYLDNITGLMLNTNPLSRDGFQLGFSYSGSCVFVASVRLYFRRCPGFVSRLVGFEGTSAGAGLVAGSCLRGAQTVEGQVNPPQRECRSDGVWGALQGECTCSQGHEEKEDACEACRSGYYKAANSSMGCAPCPPNSETDGEGAVECNCKSGYFRFHSDPYQMGCTKPPSAPVNVAVHHLNDSILTLDWDPPIDLGGRQEVTYEVECLERDGDTDSQWKACGEAVILLPDSAGLTVREVNLTGVSPWFDYRLLVRASNNLSFHQGEASLVSVASVTINRWKSPVIKTVVTLPKVPSPTTQKAFVPWWVVVAVLGGFVFLALISAAVFSLQRKYTRLSHDQEGALLPIHTGVVFRRVEEARSAGVHGTVHLLDGVSHRLLTNLRSVLVDRDKLTLGKELGAGEFGSVYQGIFTPEEGLNINVAVKTLKVGINSKEDLESFLKEAELMQHFDHNNVVKLLGVTLEQEQGSPLPTPLVILPYMKHGDLRRFLIATRYGDIPMFVPLQSLLRFMIDIAAGMEYLSSKGFLHRDLAARNCMLGDDLRVCVADFGLSKEMYSCNYYRQTSIIRMPIKWMAMESLSESIFTSKTDVWSFGVTMWEILSRGKTPYPGVHNHELLDLLNAGHRLKPPECENYKLYEVMLSCWHGEPGQRPGFMELGDRLRALLCELPPLEASEEAHYINQGLEAATHSPQDVNGSNDEPGSEGGAVGNVYLPTPGAAAKPAAKKDREEDEEGYLTYKRE